MKNLVSIFIILCNDQNTLCSMWAIIDQNILEPSSETINIFNLYSTFIGSKDLSLKKLSLNNIS